MKSAWQITRVSPTVQPRSGNEQLSNELAAQLERVLRQLEQGKPVDVEQLKREHPEIADELEQCVANLQFVEDIANLFGSESDRELSGSASAGASDVDTCIGDYRIIRELGRGGMGVVYEAEQISLRRNVALKILPYAAVLDNRALQRFRNEVTAAAQLDHPNIVDIYAVGCDRGVHHFAMKLIDGCSLYEIIRQLRHMRDSQVRFPASISSIVPNSNDKMKFPLQVPDPVPAESQSDVDTALQKTTWRSRTKGESVGYFRSIAEFGGTVADALDFAHQRGIVHRDVKPSNLMIDSTGKAWIADFGLAQIETGTALTRTGDLLGTARYMSPEQIEGKRVILDHRTDIYSLGVTLYELLTLQLPFEADNRQDLFRQILLDAPKSPREIQPSIPVDLETIVLKAMEKSTNDRYQSAAEMAADLQRFLNQETILARRPTTIQRFKKWTLRHPSVIYSTTITLLLLTVVSLIFSTLLWKANFQAQVNLKKAQDAIKAEQTANTKTNLQLQQIVKGYQVLASLLIGINPREKADGPTLFEQLVDRATIAADELNSESVGDALAVARLQSIMGKTLEGLGNPEKAIEVLEKARKTLGQELGTDNSETLICMGNLGVAYESAGRTNQALQILEETLRIRQENLQPNHIDILKTSMTLGGVYLSAGKLDQAIAILEPTMKTAQTELGPDHPETLTAMSNLGSAYIKAGKLDQAVPLLQETRIATEARFGPEDDSTLIAMTNLAEAFQMTGRFDDAISLCENALRATTGKLGPDHPDALRIMTQLASAYTQNGQPEQCILLLEKPLKSIRTKLGSDHPGTFAAMNNLGLAYMDTGKSDLALPLFKDVLKSEQEKYGPGNPITLPAANNLALAYMNTGQTELALPIMEETLKYQQEKLGLDHPGTITSLNNLAGAYWSTGNREKSVQFYQLAAEGIEKRGFEHEHAAFILPNTARAFDEAGKFAQAERWRRKWLAQVKQRFGSNSIEYASGLAGLGLTLLNQKKWTESEEVLRECLQIREAEQPDVWTTFLTQTCLGQSLLGNGQFASAEPLLLSGYNGMKERESRIPPEAKFRILESVQRIVDLYTDLDQPVSADQWRAKLSSGE
jgi:serine/threonine protein kinase/Tfp pilus assembly protein PilF